MGYRARFLFHLYLALLTPGDYGASHDGNDNCQCYQIESGKDTSYFSNYRFYDFRYFAVNDTSDFSKAPAAVTEAGQTGSVQPVLKSDFFTTDWAIQDWGHNGTADSPVARYNSLSNIYVMATNNTDLGEHDTSATTYLNFRTLRLPAFQSTAEIENTQKDLMYASVRFRARILGSAGACAGLFIVHDDDNEADIEILTRDPHGTYHYSNQPDFVNDQEVPGASVQLDGQPDWTEWHTHRLDWLPGVVRSYIDDRLVDEKTVNVPKKPTNIDINMWSDGGTWSGNMTEGGEANLQIQWVETAFNVSSNVKRDDGCSKICVIDGTNQTGTPVLSSTKSSAGGKAIQSTAATIFACTFCSMMFL